MDTILVDMLMYTNNDIVQEALNLLIVHKSQKVTIVALSVQSMHKNVIFILRRYTLKSLIKCR